jgi:hypothetical protein
MANTFDDTKLSYTVKKINTDGSVDVLFDCDGKTQNISGLDLSSADNLTNALDAYTFAYIAGKQQEALDAAPPQVPNDVTALLNKVQVAEQPVAPAPETPVGV